jgi:NAD(P)-dependent dehydrogenase (short-subunit alcohol dehydrogenase family)
MQTKLRFGILLQLLPGYYLFNALTVFCDFCKYLAYEYARRGACLALAARRQERLRAVADKARALGSPDVIVIPTDISKVEDSERFINEAVNHFGKCKDLLLSSFNFNLCARFFHKRSCFTMTHGVYAIVDHLVNNAGVVQIDMFEDCKQISDFATLTVCFLVQQLILIGSDDALSNNCH